MIASVDFKYRAFLSYAHADVARGKRLHAQLEAFRIAKDLVGRETPRGNVPKSLRPIFRDREDFSGGHTLTDATIAALDQSAALIVLCSPIAATRPAVNDEVRLFRHRHPDRPVIPVMIDGIWPNNVPPALLFEIAEDGSLTDRSITILGPDLREEADGRQLGLAKIVAGLIGVGTDEIVRRADRDRQRRLRFWIAGLSTVIIALAGLSVWAEINRREAVALRLVAERNFTLAKDAANSLVYDIAAGLKDVEGMRIEAVRTILGRAEDAYSKLAEKSKDDELIAGQSGLYDQFADAYGAQGDTQKQMESAEKAVALMRSLVEKDPSNARWNRGLTDSQIRFADARKAQGDLDGALDLYRQALAMLDRLRLDKPGDLDVVGRIASVESDIGDTMFNKGNFESALAAYRRALDHRQWIAGQPGGTDRSRQPAAIVYGKIGEILVEQGKLPEALASFEATLAIHDQLQKDHPEDALYWRGAGVDLIHIGDVKRTLGDNAAAEKRYAEARDRFRRLTEFDPDNTLRLRDLSIALERLAQERETQGDLDAAMAFQQERHTIAAKLAERDPRKAEWQLDLAVSHDHIGDLLRKLGRMPESRQQHRDSIAIFGRLVSDKPASARFDMQFANALRSLAEVELALGDNGAAMQHYGRALAIGRKLVGIDETNARFLRDISLTHAGLKEAHLAVGDNEAALASGKESLAIAEQLVRIAPTDVDWQRDVAVSHWSVALVEQRLRRPELALAGFRRAHEIISELRIAGHAHVQPDLDWLDVQIKAVESALPR